MRIQLLSDLHFETQADGGLSLIESLDASRCDVLVLAGDICAGLEGLEQGLRAFCQKFTHVVYVPGNHEFWHITRSGLLEVLDRVSKAHPNFHPLNRSVVTIEGQRFVGTTLWFSDTPMARQHARYWADFTHILDLGEWVYTINRLDRMFFARELQPGDVAVSHHLPSFLSVAPEYAGEASNCYFVSDIEETILQKRPALWLHGHTHASIRATLGSTTLLTNPFGYATLRMLNPRFDENLIIEVNSG